MAGRKRKFTTEEALESFFADVDSDTEEVDLGDEDERLMETFHGDSDLEYDSDEKDDQKGAEGIGRPESEPFLQAEGTLKDCSQSTSTDATLVDTSSAAPEPTQPANLAWRKVNEDNFSPADIPFSGVEGLKVRMGNNTSPMDFFQLYFTTAIVELIVKETNRYAEQCINAVGTPKQYSYMRNWTETDFFEIQTFLGILFLMGIVYKPRIPLYWSKDDLYSTPIFSEVMSRDRFYSLLKFLHFNDNNVGKEDRLSKLRPLLEMIKSRCQNVFYPGRDICVDESLVLYKGRLAFRQYIRTKRARFGVKIYELCTSSGITLDFLIYCGAGMFSDNDDEFSGMSVTEKIPAILTKQYYGNGHCLFLDNFYTSITLAQHLLDNKMYVCGTIKPQRKHFPHELVAENLEKGGVSFYSKGKLLACKFRAAQNKSGNKPKIVYMLTSAHKPSVAEIDKKSRVGQTVVKPTCVIDYNHQMGGVDLVDQQLHHYHTLRKTYKWYRKIALRLLMQCLLNAHKVYQQHTGNRDLDFLEFNHQVIASMLIAKPRLGKTVVVEETVIRLTGRHFPAKKKANPGNKDQRPTKYCRVCYARGIRTEKGAPLKTVFICKTCPSQPGLHVEKDCFEVYHTVLDYSTV